MPAWERDLREKLKKPVTVEFHEASLKEACETLSKLAGVPIRIDPAIGAKSTPITLPKCTMRAQSVLMWICRFNLCRYVFKDGAVLVTPLPSSGKLQAQIYDLPDLTPPEARTEERPREVAVCSGWCRYIRAAIAPDTWREELGGNCSGERQGIVVCAGRRLIVVHTEAVQAEVAKFVDAHSKMRKGLQVHILKKFLRIDRAEVEALKLQFQPGRAGSASCAPVRKDQAEALLEAIVRKRKGAVLCAPRLTCYNTQRANFQVLKNYSHVPRITVVEPPEVEPEGLLLDIQPFVSPDRKHITVIIEGEFRPPRDAPALPRADSVVTLPDGGSGILVLAAPTAGRHEFKDKSLVAVLLTAEVVQDIFEE